MNKNLEFKMIVKKDDIEVEWAVMKKTSIMHGGFGGFALKNFNKDEVVSVYLGDKGNSEEKVDYVFLDVNGRPDMVKKVE